MAAEDADANLENQRCEGVRHVAMMSRALILLQKALREP